MPSMLEISTITLLSLFLIALLIMLYSSYNFGRQLDRKTIVRGINGKNGTRVSLSCPPGSRISFRKTGNIPRVVAMCDSDESCDPQYNAGENYYNPHNTIDLVDRDSALRGCEGQENCEYTLPIQSSPLLGEMCNGKKCNGTVYISGTFDCVPK